MATKKKVSRKKPAKKTTLTRTSTASASSNFWKIEFTVGTLYWLAIGIGVIATGMWTYNTNEVTNDIYDQIAERSAEIDSTPVKKAPVQDTSTDEVMGY